MNDFDGENSEPFYFWRELTNEFVHPLMPSADGTLNQYKFDYPFESDDWPTPTCALDAFWDHLERTENYAEALLESPDSSEVVRDATLRYIDYLNVMDYVILGAPPFNTYTEAQRMSCATLFAFHCGILFQQLPMLQLEKTIKSGTKQTRNLKEAWEARRVNVSADEVRDKLAETQAANPRLSKTQALRLSAKELGVGYRTAWRRLSQQSQGSDSQ